MAEVRLTRHLHRLIRADLERPHPFAAERVGFGFGKLANLEGSEALVLLHRYKPVRDDYYVLNPRFGACIGPDAIRDAMQEVRDRRGTREGAFHVHLHDHAGEPRLSGPDRAGLPPLIPGLRRMGMDGAHGLLVLSQDHGIAWVWLPEGPEPVRASRVVVVGAPLGIFEARCDEL